METIDVLGNVSSGSRFFLTPNQKNNYFSIHKLNIENSKVISGKFTRSGFENVSFDNPVFKKYLQPLEDLNNSTLLRLVNIFFKDTKNKLKTGLVYKSHFVDDVFEGATIYNSFWLGGSFSDGLFKSSVWVGGNFNGGKFVDSRDATIFSFDFDDTKTNKLWQGGNFNGGEFYNSLWVNGQFNGGRFYFSDWTGGTWSNGVLGSKDFRTQDTTMAYFGPTTSFGATHTVWLNGLVENATIGGAGSIDWYGGKMLGGEFTSQGRLGKTYSIWYDGDFYGGSFTKQAWWKGGNFYGGKFLSEIGWDKVNLLTYSNDSFDYGWVGGNFIDGEFGNGNYLTNSTWYDGIIEGGIFQGRFWRNGLITNGKFYGSLSPTQSTPDVLLMGYTYSFYGLWNGGFVDNVIFNVKRDVIVSTEELIINNRTSKSQPRQVDMFGVVWKSGTFSHESGNFNNSIWLDGEFNAGNFNNSYFNPFVDLSLSNKTLSDYRISTYLENLYTEIQTIIDNINYELPLNIPIQEIIDSIGRYNTDSEIQTKFVIDFYNEQFYYEFPPEYNTIEYSTRDFSEISQNVDKEFHTTILRIYDEDIIKKDTREHVGVLFYLNEFEDGVRDVIISKNYPNSGFKIPYSYNLKDTCIWKGGNFNGGEINYSKWLGGSFNDGTASGVIWLDGVLNYGFMYNCYWENGVWRNGNWDGSPFNTISGGLNSNFEIDNIGVKQILTNISNYNSNNPNIHLSNVYEKDQTSDIVHRFNAEDFIVWKVDEQNSTQ